MSKQQDYFTEDVKIKGRWHRITFIKSRDQWTGTIEWHGKAYMFAGESIDTIRAAIIADAESGAIDAFFDQQEQARTWDEASKENEKRDTK